MPPQDLKIQSTPRTSPDRSLTTKFGPISRIQASSFDISITLMCDGNMARAFLNCRAETHMVTGSLVAIAVATRAYARCAGLAPNGYSSVRSGQIIQQRVLDSMAPGMRKPSARGVVRCSRDIRWISLQELALLVPRATTPSCHETFVAQFVRHLADGLA